VWDRRTGGLEPFTISADGHYVGKDGFIVPKDFGEFFERYPLRVRRWLTRRVRQRFSLDTILNLEQDLLVYLCTPAPNSRFRQRGANGRPDGCRDVIQCFDPVRHFGATAARFHNFINLCLANRLNTFLARQRLNPLCNPRNVSIVNFRENENGPESAGEVDEAYLFSHSGTFARECRRSADAEDAVLKAYVREFEQFVLERENPSYSPWSTQSCELPRSVMQRKALVWPTAASEGVGGTFLC
jgi:hypothetical protein